MNKSIKKKLARRGVAAPEWYALVGLLAVVVFLGWSSFGGAVRDHVESTAEGVADPARLLDHFSDRATDAATPDDGDDSSNKKGGPKGNNGVGNGEDAPPPGNAPVNDGPGTSPGNPGNKGPKK